MTKTGKKTGAKVIRLSKARKKVATKGVRKTTKPKTKSAASTKTNSASRSVSRAKKANGSNVIWKLLEMKEAHRKEMSERAAQNQNRNHGQSGKYHPRNFGFSKFAGPRRRAS